MGADPGAFRVEWNGSGEPFASQERGTRVELRDFVQSVKDRVEIEAVIGRHVRLERAGARLRGLCPFHAEKTASFYVSPERRSFKCFGCNEGGDVIHFVRMIEGLEFMEALRNLAAEAGVAWPSELQRGSAGDRSLREEAHEALQRAVKLYREALRSPVGEPAREYLRDRGVLEEEWDRFHLGWAPDEPGWLVDRLQRQGVSEQALETAGLARRKPGKPLGDFFRERLLFPVFRNKTQPVGFGGRLMPGSWADRNGLGKYVNSADTPVFSKQQLLYGFEQMPTHVRGGAAGEPILLAEGYLDVILLHQAGFRTSVGALGTAFTEHHARRLGRTKRPVVLLLDADAAGREAAAKAGLVLVREGVDVRVCELPEGQDPADLVTAGQVEDLSQRVRNARDILEWRLETEGRREDFHLPAVRARVARNLAVWIESTPDPVLAEVWTQRSAGILGVSEDNLKRLTQPTAPAAGPQTAPSHTHPPSDSPAAGGEIQAETRSASPAHRRLRANEREIVCIFLHDPSLHARYRSSVQALLAADWADPTAQEVLNWQVQVRGEGLAHGALDALQAFPDPTRFRWLDRSRNLETAHPQVELERALQALPGNRETVDREDRRNASVPSDDELLRFQRRVEISPTHDRPNRTEPDAYQDAGQED